MADSSRKLLYLTLGYPGDIYSEKCFVEGELKALRDRFDTVILVPTDDFGRDAGYADALPDGVEVDWTLVEDKVLHSRARRLPYIFHPAVLRNMVSMIGEARSPAQWIKGFFQNVNVQHISKVIKNITAAHGMNPRNSVLMSLWFYDPAGALALLGLKEGWHVATHAHTGDLYDERMLFRSRSLRDRLLAGFDFVFPISEKGARYMRARYPRHADKIMMNPLGSTRLFTPEFKKSLPSGEVGNTVLSKTYPGSKAVVFMTVARLHEVKCHDLILDVLSQLAITLPYMDFVWEVIGDGELLDSLREKASRTPGNLSVVFHGALPNREIQKRFLNHPPHWFIMMSRSEGLPVSMGEAMSYAVPVITTDVGDVRELVNDDCAVILPPPYPDDSPAASRRDPKEYADLLAPIVCDDNYRSRLAKAALVRWESFFDASKSSSRIADLIASLIP